MSSHVVVLAEPDDQRLDDHRGEKSAKRAEKAPAAGPEDSYFEVARTPIASLLFVLPFLAVYEIGVLLGGPTLHITRNAADSWMRLRLYELGVTRPWVLPALVVGTLLAVAAYQRRRTWIDSRLFLGMLSECVFAAWLLVAIGQAAGVLLRAGGLLSLSGTAQGPAEWAAACVGAGLYEETLFRLWGLPAAYLLMRLFLVPKRVAFWVALTSTSIGFAAAHYFGTGFTGTGQEWFTFTFRLLAGVCFAALLLKRGFGIAVGTHVIYDATVLLLAAAVEPGVAASV